MIFVWISSTVLRHSSFICILITESHLSTHMSGREMGPHIRLRFREEQQPVADKPPANNLYTDRPRGKCRRNVEQRHNFTAHHKFAILTHEEIVPGGCIVLTTYISM